MKTSRKFISLLLAALMVFSLLPTAAFAEDITNDYWYTDNNPQGTVYQVKENSTDEMYLTGMRALLDASTYTTYTLTEEAQQGKPSSSSLTNSFFATRQYANAKNGIGKIVISTDSEETIKLFACAYTVQIQKSGPVDHDKGNFLYLFDSAVNNEKTVQLSDICFEISENASKTIELSGVYFGKPLTQFCFDLLSNISKDTKVTVKIFAAEHPSDDSYALTTEYTFKPTPVAQIGEQKFVSLAAAIDAATKVSGTAENPTIVELYPGEVQNGGLTLNNVVLNHVVFRGASDGTSTWKDCQINFQSGTGAVWDDVKFENIIFDNSGITFSTNSTPQKNLTVDGCTFKNLNRSGNIAGMHFNATCENFTFTNNIFDTSAGSSVAAVNGNAFTGNLTVTGNTFKNSCWRPLQLQIKSDDSIADVVVIQNNLFVDNASGVQIVGNGADTDDGSITVTNNAFVDGKTVWFNSVSNTNPIDVSRNYWKGGAKPTVGTDYGPYDCTPVISCKGYATKYEANESGRGATVSSFGGAVAQISEKQYYSLADALAEATTGTAEQPVVIEVLADAEAPATITASNVKITANSNNRPVITGLKQIGSGSQNLVFENLEFQQANTLNINGTNTKLLNCDIKMKSGVTFSDSNLSTISGTNTWIEGCAFQGTSSGSKQLAPVYGTNVTIKNSTFDKGWGAMYYSTAKGTWTIDGCTFTNIGCYCIHTGECPADVVVKNTKIDGWCSFGSSVRSLSFEGCTFDKTDGAYYSIIRPYIDATLTNCKFTERFVEWDDVNYGDKIAPCEDAVVIMNGCTVIDANGTTSTKYTAIDAAHPGAGCDFNDGDKGGIVAIDPVGNATDGYTAGVFVTKETTRVITPAQNYKLKTLEENVYQVVPFDKVAIPVGQNFVYDENAKTGVKENTAYTLTGTASATNVGTYTATATLKAGYQWADGTTEAKSVTWEILKQSQSAPAKGEGYEVDSSTGAISAKSGYELKTEGTSYFVRKAEKDNYFASPYTAIDTTVSINAVASPANMGTVSITGVTDGKCTIGTSVTVTAAANDGYKFVKWMDKDAQASTNAAYTFTATAGRTLIAVFEPADKTVVQIPVAENKTYTGTLLTGVTATTNCSVTGNAGTDAGTYTATATLDNTETSVWADGTTTSKTITWVIYKASQTAPTGVVGGENSITGVDNTMEYVAKGDNTYTAINGDSISDLAAGTYYVRKAADTNHLASPAVVVTVSLPTITVTTIQPEVTGKDTAKLYGIVTPYDATRITKVGFRYSTNGTSWTDVSDSTAAASFSMQLNGLAVGTKYIAQAYVVADSTTIYGAQTTFYTLAAAATGEIDVFLDKDANREITLTIEKGNAAIASVTLVENTWKFNELADGFYNIVVRTTDGDFTETRLVEVTGGKVVASSFSIPTGKIATVVEVKTAETPDVAVDGLAEILTETEKNEAAAGSVDVEVKLEVEAKEVETEEIETKAAVDAIKKVINSGVAIATEETIETVLDLSLIKTTSALDEKGEVASVDIQNIGSENDKVLEIAVPYADATAGAAINVYRVHDGAAEKLMQLSSRPSGSFVDGTYFVGEGYIFIYASDFSTYAISSVGEITEFTVTFDANGGYCNTPSAKTNTSRKLASLPTASRFGYSFNGWYTEKTGGEKISTDTEFTADKTVYAHWTMNYDPTPITPVTPTYTITNADTGNGKLTISRKTAAAGQTVTITVTPDEGYKLDTLTAKDAKDNVLTLTKINDTTYTFKMPSGKVTISATFTEIVDSAVCPQDATCVYAKFTDADTKAWYHDGVHFCVENGYMQGVSATAFDPAGTTTRAMIVTMLWRMEGEPVVNYAMSFKDVKADQWYTEAIRWAQSTGVVEGYSAEAFGPDDPITREQMATILYRYAKYHEIDVANTNTLAGFTDVNKVSSWALDAMKWANAVGLVQGRTTTTLVPDVNINRAEAATMVQRYCEKVCKD